MSEITGRKDEELIEILEHSPSLRKVVASFVQDGLLEGNLEEIAGRLEIGEMSDIGSGLGRLVGLGFCNYDAGTDHYSVNIPNSTLSYIKGSFGSEDDDDDMHGLKYDMKWELFYKPLFDNIKDSNVVKMILIRLLENPNLSTTVQGFVRLAKISAETPITEIESALDLYRRIDLIDSPEGTIGETGERIFTNTLDTGEIVWVMHYMAKKAPEQYELIFNPHRLKTMSTNRRFDFGTTDGIIQTTGDVYAVLERMRNLDIGRTQAE